MMTVQAIPSPDCPQADDSLLIQDISEKHRCIAPHVALGEYTSLVSLQVSHAAEIIQYGEPARLNCVVQYVRLNRRRLPPTSETTSYRVRVFVDECRSIVARLVCPETLSTQVDGVWLMASATAASACACPAASAPPSHRLMPPEAGMAHQHTGFGTVRNTGGIGHGSPSG